MSLYRGLGGRGWEKPLQGGSQELRGQMESHSPAARLEMALGIWPPFTEVSLSRGLDCGLSGSWVSPLRGQERPLAAGCGSSAHTWQAEPKAMGLGTKELGTTECATEPGTTEPDATQLGTMKRCVGHRGATHVPTEPSDPAAGVGMVPAPWWGETPLLAPPDMPVCPRRCPGQARRVPGAGHGLHRGCHPGGGPSPHQQPSPPKSKSWGGSG